jgi:hypothetical protein
MMKPAFCFALALWGLFVWPGSATVRSAEDEPEKYLLRYHFEPGQSLRWDVVHRTRIRTSVSGTTQTAETTSCSVKLWRVTEVKPDGTATFEHLVESVDMRHKLTGRDEVRYDSTADEEPPPGYENVARAVGVPLSVITLDSRGNVIKRERKPLKAAAQSEGEITIPFPQEAIAVGHSWSYPHETDVVLETGGMTKVKAVQRFTLESVKTGVATIRVATQILTPLDDPAIQAKVVQYEKSGVIRFDVDAGRTLSQQTDVDRHVVGFRGGASSLHYVNRFTEQFLPDAPKVAARP